MSENFAGYEPDDEGYLRFMTVETDFVVTSLEQSVELFYYLAKLAVENPGYMPILTFNTYET